MQIAMFPAFIISKVCIYRIPICFEKLKWKFFFFLIKTFVIFHHFKFLMLK